MNFVKSLWRMIVGARVELTGQWEGSYGFGSDYPLENQKLRVSFIATIRETGKQFEAALKKMLTEFLRLQRSMAQSMERKWRS